MNMGLTINESKTKLMAATQNKRTCDLGQNISVGDYNLKVLQNIYIWVPQLTKQMIPPQI